MRFGTWNLRSLFMSGSLTSVTRGLEKYKLSLVGVQKIRCNKVLTVRAGDCIFFCGQENENHQLGAGHFVHHKILSAVKRVDFVSDRMSYIVLRDCWCNIIVLNVHAPSWEKSDEIKDFFCEELYKVFDHFP
jgi:cell wall-associated NlpC family hydrolase